jgi:hypothetical protein
MRSALRVLGGLVLLAAGVLALGGGVVAWVLGERHTADDGAFTAPLAPVATEGYAIVVPDVSEVVARHGVARYLGDGRLTITVRSSMPGPDGVLVVALVPAADAIAYLSTSARTEIRSVGYATGEQPVQTVALAGGAPQGRPAWEVTEPAPGVVVQAGRVATVSLNLPSDRTMTLVIRRWDGSASVAVTMTAGLAPSSWGTATMTLLIAGPLGTLSGLALLILRQPWIDPLLLDPDEGEPVAARPAEIARRQRGRHTGRSPTHPAAAMAHPATVVETPTVSPYVYTAT